MRRLPKTTRLGRLFGLSAVLVGAGLTFLTGCPTTPADDGVGIDPDVGREITAQIVSPTSVIGVSVLDDQPITVSYSVSGSPTSIMGFRVPVAGPASDSASIGAPVVIAPDLDPGTNQFFSFIPADAGVGFFRVGLLWVADGAEQRVESSGVFEVEGHPDPLFTRPESAVTVVEQGGTVEITFDAQDPQNRVKWRLFYLAPTDSRSNPPDTRGTTLDLDSGNVGVFEWITPPNLTPGDYELGLAATDSGDSIEDTVRTQPERVFTIPHNGTTTPIIRVVASGASTPPTLGFSTPGGSDVTLFRNQAFTIRFTGTVADEATGSIDIFYDDDRNANNGYVLLGQELAVTVAAVSFSSDLPAGFYNIGGTIRDGVNDPVTVYAGGRIDLQSDE